MSDCNSSSYLQNVSVVGRSSMQWGRGHFSEQYCSEYDELLKSLFESKQSTRKTNYEIFNEIKIQSNFVFYHTQSITKITLQPRGGKTELQRVDKDLNGQGQGRPRDMRSGHKGSFHWFRLKACRDKQSVTKHATAEILGPGRPCIAHLCLAILPDSASAKSGQRGWKTVPWGTIPGAASENHSTLWMLNVCACYARRGSFDWLWLLACWRRVSMTKSARAMLPPPLDVLHLPPPMYSATQFQFWKEEGGGQSIRCKTRTARRML